MQWAGLFQGNLSELLWDGFGFSAVSPTVSETQMGSDILGDVGRSDHILVMMKIQIFKDLLTQ